MKSPYDDSLNLTIFMSDPSMLTEGDDMDAEIRAQNDQIVDEFEELNDDFGWTVERVKMLNLKIIEYNPLIERMINLLPFAKDDSEDTTLDVWIMHPAPENIPFQGFINEDNTSRD